MTAYVGETASFTCAGEITASSRLSSFYVSPVLEPNVAHTTHNTSIDGIANMTVHIVASADTNGTTFYCQFVARYSDSTSYNATSHTVALLVLNETESKLVTKTF